MTRFHYQATDADGNPASGQLEAADVKSMVARLEAMGLRAESIRPIDPDRGAADLSDAASQPPLGRGSERLGRDDLHQLARQLSDLTQAQLPLAPGLKAFAAELPKGRLRRSLRAMVQQLERGDDLETVLASRNVPDDLLALLRAGVRTGNPGQALAQYVMHARQLVEIQRQVALGLGYPLVLLTLAVLLFVGFVALIVPEFKTIFNDFAIALPAVTESLLALSDVVTGLGWRIVVIAACLVIGLWLALRSAAGRGISRQLTRGLPLLGRMFRDAGMARFSHLLAVLMQEGIPLPEAIVLAGSGSGEPQLREASGHLARRVAAGETLARSASDLACFPASFVQAIRWEKHTDAIPELLRALAEMFEAQARDRAAVIAAVCEPLIICLTAGLLGYLVLGLMLPLVSLISNLSG